MQKITVTGANGKSVIVRVLCSWQAAGVKIFLHENGTYGYLNGDPVRSADELDIIPEPEHTSAIFWWNAIGRGVSEKRYGSSQALQQATPATNTAYYLRFREIKPSPPPSPMDYLSFGFRTKPDWWGSAVTITLSDGYTYERFTGAEATAEAEATAPETVTYTSDTVTVDDF